MASHFQMPTPPWMDEKADIDVSRILVQQNREITSLGDGGYEPPFMIKTEDLLRNNIVVSLQECEVRLQPEKPLEGSVKDDVLQRAYGTFIRQMGVSSAFVTAETWEHLLDASVPTSELTQQEQDALEHIIELILQTAIQAGITAVVVWLVLRWKGAGNSYTFKSEGGDIVIGTANISEKYYLASQKPLQVAPSILLDKRIKVEAFSELPSFSHLRHRELLARPVILLSQGHDGLFTSIPKTPGYTNRDDFENIPITSRKKPFLTRLLNSLTRPFSRKRRVDTKASDATPKRLASVLPPLIHLKLYFKGMSKKETFLTDSCWLVVDERPYMWINDQRIEFPSDVAMHIVDALSSSRPGKLATTLNKKQLLGIGADYLNVALDESAQVEVPLWILKRLARDE